MPSTEDDQAILADKSAFAVTIDRCFDDKRITGYFKRGLVDKDKVRDELIYGDAFDLAKDLSSYHEYDALRRGDYDTLSRTERGPSLSILSLVGLRAGRTSDLTRARENWLADSVERVIIPNATLAINTILGKDQDLLLVEQDSEGLRRLQDPTFRVPTRTRERLITLIAQMDGGSVAIAGPRGAGKSTLLKAFSTPLDDDITSARTIAIYVPAPSNYVARDFLAELFQQLCEAYLSYCDYPVSEELYRTGTSRIRKRQIIRKALRISWLAIRAAIALALIISVSWLLIAHSPMVRSSNLPPLHHLASETEKLARDWWHKHRAYFVAGIVVVAAWLVWPPLRLWRTSLRHNREPELIKRAREYLLRLRVDKTVTRGAGIGPPTVRGLGFSMNRASSVKYTPWTLPELVSHTRRFIEDISLQMKVSARSSRPVVVAIDEIDRIGSLEDAEGFIGEIKAVFGVEGCYFLVAVADDVGSLFAQRATAGRSILENAFDEIVAVGPLALEEASNLLLKRVPGFTDAFVYLVYALSGGLPRELIRITRRLIEMNLEQLAKGAHPRLEDLALVLVTESMIDALDASRNQMSRLSLSPDWAQLFDGLRSASITLRRDRSLPYKLYQAIEELSKVSTPDVPVNTEVRNIKAQDSEEAAARIVNNLSAFAYFARTIIDAFSDRWFNLNEVRQKTESGADNGYEELAAARIELGVSYASARLILGRFRSSLYMP